MSISPSQLIQKALIKLNQINSIKLNQIKLKDNLDQLKLDVPIESIESTTSFQSNKCRKLNQLSEVNHFDQPHKSCQYNQPKLHTCDCCSEEYKTVTNRVNGDEYTDYDDDFESGDDEYDENDSDYFSDDGDEEDYDEHYSYQPDYDPDYNEDDENYHNVCENVGYDEDGNDIRAYSQLNITSWLFSQDLSTLITDIEMDTKIGHYEKYQATKKASKAGKIKITTSSNDPTIEEKSKSECEISNIMKHKQKIKDSLLVVYREREWTEYADVYRRSSQLQACTCNLLNGNRVDWFLPNIRLLFTRASRESTTPSTGWFQIDSLYDRTKSKGKLNNPSSNHRYRVWMDSLKVELSGIRLPFLFLDLANCWMHEDSIKIIYNSFKRAGHSVDWTFERIQGDRFGFELNTAKRQLQLGFVFITWPTTWKPRQIWSFHRSVSKWMITSLTALLYRLFRARPLDYVSSHQCISFEEQKRDKIAKHLEEVARQKQVTSKAIKVAKSIKCVKPAKSTKSTKQSTKSNKFANKTDKSTDKSIQDNSTKDNSVNSKLLAASSLTDTIEFDIETNKIKVTDLTSHSPSISYSTPIAQTDNKSNSKRIIDNRQTIKHELDVSDSHLVIRSLIESSVQKQLNQVHQDTHQNEETQVGCREHVPTSEFIDTTKKIVEETSMKQTSKILNLGMSEKDIQPSVLISSPTLENMKTLNAKNGTTSSIKSVNSLEHTMNHLSELEKIIPLNRLDLHELTDDSLYVHDVLNKRITNVSTSSQSMSMSPSFLHNSVYNLPIQSSIKSPITPCKNLLSDEYRIHFELLRISNAAYSISLSPFGSFSFLDTFI
ncbi:MAG: hypothetical protein Sylvanvirus21_7 [Sylvanvirus sp.]|uniref:Uncharacterized protein n=1 Tax=Sylvanvirus sp. TaxID=2487774 RepID=A0A3G5AIM5_9VIRU|nr:MAG: hypothetical protein Sylvanvirus21_7 [Sylvanvirus sp.]